MKLSDQLKATCLKKKIKCFMQSANFCPVMTIKTKVIALEQICAVNSGGEAHTDSDGIIYQPQTENKNRENFDVNSYMLDIGTVGEIGEISYRGKINTRDFSHLKV
jgi:hypothetical protein